MDKKELIYFLIEKGITFDQALQVLEECKTFIIMNRLIDGNGADMLSDVIKLPN